MEIKERLLKANLSYNKYRHSIIEYIEDSKAHPDAEMIYKNIKLQYPNISLATIYNNINTFIDKNLVFALKTPSPTLRYDTTRTKHFHFYCEACDDIFDVPENEVKWEKLEFQKKGFDLKKIDLLLYGTCPACKKNNLVNFNKENLKKVFVIKDMTNNVAARNIKNALTLLPEITKVKIKLKQQEVHTEGSISSTKLKRVLKKIGYNIN